MRAPGWLARLVARLQRRGRRLRITALPSERDRVTGSTTRVVPRSEKG